MILQCLLVAEASGLCAECAAVGEAAEYSPLLDRVLALKVVEKLGGSQEGTVAEDTFVHDVLICNSNQVSNLNF